MTIYFLFLISQNFKMEKEPNLPPYPGPPVNQTSMPNQIQPVAYQPQPGELTPMLASERDELNWFSQFIIRFSHALYLQFIHLNPHRAFQWLQPL